MNLRGSLRLSSYLQNGQVMKAILQNYLAHHRHSLDVIQNKYISKEGPKTLLQTIWLSHKVLGNSRSKRLARLRSNNWRWSGYLELVHYVVHKINTTISLHSSVITTNQGHILTWAQGENNSRERQGPFQFHLHKTLTPNGNLKREHYGQ